jgi:hypothetical protein
MYIFPPALNIYRGLIADLDTSSSRAEPTFQFQGKTGHNVRTIMYVSGGDAARSGQRFGLGSRPFAG